MSIFNAGDPANSLRGKRYIRLVRCSTKGQGDTSIDDQLSLLDDFGKRAEAIHVDDLILEGVSASMPRRFIDALIERKRLKNDFDFVLIQDTSRLTRSGSKHGASLEFQLEAAGIQIVFALDRVPEGDFGDVFKSMQYYSGRETAKAISTSATRGSQSALEQNRVAYCRRPPYGVDRLYTAPDGTPKYVIRNLLDGSQLKRDPITDVVIDRFERSVKAYRHNLKQKDELIVLIPGDPAHVETIQRIFSRKFIDGWGQHRIAQELNDMGIAGPVGIDWSMTAVMRMLKNPIYTGRSIANLWTTGIYNMRSPHTPKPSELTAKQLAGRQRPPYRVRPREEWVERDEPRLTELLEPRVRALAVAQQDEWLAAKAGGYEPKANLDRHRDSKYILKDILTSKQGGLALTGQLRGRKPNWKRYYSVSKSFKRPRKNDKVLRKAVLAAPLEELILNVVRITLLSAPMLKSTLKREIELGIKQSGGAVERLAKLQAQLDDLQRQTTFVVENIVLFGDADAKTRLAAIARQRDEANRQMTSEVLAGATPNEDADVVADRLVAKLKAAGTAMDVRCRPALRALLQLLVAKAEVDLESGHLDLELRLPKSALAAPELMGLATASSRKPSGEAHHEGLLLVRFGALRLPKFYVAYRKAA